MNRTAHVISMHSRDRLSWFLLPWIVVGSSFVINLFIAVLLGGTTAFYTGGLASIYIVILVTGAITVAGTFPFALGFGVRRRDYVLGTLALAVAMNAVWAVLLVLLSVIEANVIPNWGVHLHYFHLPYFSNGSVVEQFWVSFTLLLFMFLLGFLPGSVYQRYRRAGMYTLFGVTAIVSQRLYPAQHLLELVGRHLRLVCAADCRRSCLVDRAADRPLCPRVLRPAAPRDGVTGTSYHLA